MVYYIGDANKDKIDPGLLMQGVDCVQTIIKDKNTPDIFDFLGRYVRKTHTDDLISVIRPSDIAYVIALMKNAERYGIRICG
jgi:hypothetical protein